MEDLRVVGSGGSYAVQSLPSEPIGVHRWQIGPSLLPWTLREVAALVNGRLAQGDPGTRVLGVRHDSRKVHRGDLYVAIEGERLDGHRFARQAARKGARAALVSRKVAGGFPQVLVADTTRALGELGRSQRLQWGMPVVAVTGSVGKTTVKDMTAHLLSGSFTTLRSEGNLNNQFGLPLTLLSLERRHQAAVVELGINHPGEMEWLSEVARPDVAVVTSIGEAHLGFFRGKAHLAAEKLKVAGSLRPGGIKVLNAEDPFLRERGKNVMTFGFKTGRVRARDIQADGMGTKFVLEAGGEAAATRMRLIGNHNVLNALAAVSTGLVFGVPLRVLASRLRGFVAPPMRMEIRNHKGVLFLNDAYNASPTSMEAALVAFSEMRGPSRRTAVLGDMLELGDFSREAHARVLRRASECALDSLVLVGPRMREAARGLPEETRGRTFCFEDAAQAAKHLSNKLERDEAVLLKGSRGMRLERILEGF
jgi:UDP-N-acetylmuramoyl-tripeptide--D-alanyl-D-alanine ligase